MREDMQYISGVLDELEAIVQDASGVPMSKGRVVVDRSDLLVMLDELRGSLPPELAEAESLRRECGATVAAAEEEAQRIIEEAHRHADAMVPETELFRRTQRRAGEVIDGAERYAEEVSGGSRFTGTASWGSWRTGSRTRSSRWRSPGRSWAASPCTGLRPGPRSSRRRPTVRAGGRAQPSEVCKEVRTSLQAFQPVSTLRS